jgi:hypothetical protein
MSQGLIKKSLLSGAVAAAAFAASPTQSDAGIMLDLRVTGGSALAPGSTADSAVVANTGTVTIDLWARISGTDTNHLNDGFQHAYAVLQSMGGGAFTSTMVVPPPIDEFTPGTIRHEPFVEFDGTDSGRDGTPANITPDGVQDWGSVSTAISNPGYFQGRSGSPVVAGGSLGSESSSTDWSFRLATFTMNIDSLTGATTDTQIKVTQPTAPAGGTTSAYAIFYDDAARAGGGFASNTQVPGNQSVVNNTNVATSGMYGDFVTLSVLIPEPASIGMLGIASLGLLARRRRA